MKIQGIKYQLYILLQVFLMLLMDKIEAIDL